MVYIVSSIDFKYVALIDWYSIDLHLTNITFHGIYCLLYENILIQGSLHLTNITFHGIHCFLYEDILIQYSFTPNKYYLSWYILFPL